MNSVTVSNYPARVTLHCGQNKVTLRYAKKGERGIGISNVALDDKAHLIVTYDDGKTQDAGAALGDVASVKAGIDSSYKNVQTSEANVTKLEASTKANADKVRQALQDTQSASTSGVDTINTLVSEKMTYMTSTFNSLLTQAKANINQLERDAEDKLHGVRIYSLEQIKTAHGDAMVDIERSVNKAEAWAVSETTPDKEPDFESPTGLTQSSRSWALLSKKKVQEAFDIMKDIKDNETNAKVSETQAGKYAGNSKASADAAKLSETNAASSASSASGSEAGAATQASNASKSATAASDSASAAKTSETNSASSASSASTSAYNAKASETNAKTSETNAATSQQSATSSATIATNWAIATTSPDGVTDADSNTGKTQSSRSWALASKASAGSASSSASIATTQASSATASANSASESATSASDSAKSASSSATAASNSASAAATSATNASNSETQASGYKTAASDSAAAAAASATSASTSATNAKASMNTANTAESSASTSATSASTSASNASKSEIAAKAAQAAAENARDDANSAVNKLTGAMKYAGQVDNYSDLESYTKNKGDVWNIVNADTAHGIKAGDNVAWNGTDWDNLSGTVDLSIYAEKADYQKTITSATADGATITFNHKDGTTSTATVNNVASATATTNDAKGQRIDTTYEKVTDASNVHTSLQNSINSLSTSKQDKLTFDLTPIADSSNPVTSSGIKAALDGKPSNTGAGASGTWGINISGNANTATKAINDGNGLTISSSYFRQYPWDFVPTGTSYNDIKNQGVYSTIALGDDVNNQVGSLNKFTTAILIGEDWKHQLIFDTGGKIAHRQSINGHPFTTLGELAYTNSNVASATKATQDSLGNTIKDTYATKADLNGVSIKANTQADWNSTDTSSVDFIKNVPESIKSIKNSSNFRIKSFNKTDNNGCPTYRIVEELNGYHPTSRPSNYEPNGFSIIALCDIRNGNEMYLEPTLMYASLGCSCDTVRSTSSYDFPVVLHNTESGKYYLAIRAAGSWKTVTLIGVFVEPDTELGEEILALDGDDTLPSGWELTHKPNSMINMGLLQAGRATQDGNGNVIADTYLKKSGDTVTGTLNVPTQAITDNSTKVANTAFVQSAVSKLVNSAPETLDTLNELSNALGNDPNFATTVTNMIGQKLDKSGGTITGPILYDKTPNDDTELPNKAYVDAAINSAVDKSATEADTKISTAHSYIKRNTAYKVGDILESPNLSHGYLIVVTQAGTTGSSEPDWATINNSLGGVVSDGTVQFYINDTLSKHALGDIVYKPVTKTGEHEYLLPLDGQALDTTKYKRLVDYLGFSTLPNLNGRYLRADTTPNTIVEAGLPNITGIVWGISGQADSDSNAGALYYNKTNYTLGENVVSVTKAGRDIRIDASRSSSIYGNSDTVTPLTYTVRAYICYA